MSLRLHRLTLFIVFSVSLCLCGSVLPAEPPAVKLLLAFGSYRERPKHSNIFFYEHDGKDNGKIIGSIGTPRPTALNSAGDWLRPATSTCPEARKGMIRGAESDWIVSMFSPSARK